MTVDRCFVSYFSVVVVFVMSGTPYEFVNKVFTYLIVLLIMFTDLLFSFTQCCSAIIIIIFLATRFAIEMGFKSEDLHTNHSW